MTKTQRHQWLKRLVLITAATVSLAACSTSETAPSTTAASKAPTSASTQAGGCDVNPASTPLPTAEPYRPVPASARISVTLSGIPSGTIKPGDPMTEVDVTLCNNSPVDYPKAGVVFALPRCSCATSPMGLPEATADRFDAATGQWVKLTDPVMGTGMDYLGGFTDVQPLPKGKVVTLKYRFALDASMTDGRGAVEAAAVMPDPLVQIGRADLPFAVSKNGASAPTAPRPTVLPFTGLTFPSGVAVDGAGDVYLADTGNNRVLKLAAGSDEQEVLPFTNLKYPGEVAVDGAGNVYVTDGGKRVVKLAAGSNEQTVVPFTRLDNVQGMTVDSAGNVYATDFRDGDTTVLKWSAASNEQTVLPFTDVASANSVAVDDAGTVYLNDSPNSRVLTLATGATEQTVLPLTGIEHPQGLAVDGSGDVYVVDSTKREVVKVGAGSHDQTAVPSALLYGPHEVAVSAGDVYVIDSSGFGQVLKLATT
jgi:streptogramin lyase